MPYLIDRHRTLWSRQIVGIVSLRQRRVRSRVIFKDNSLYHTLTRPTTFLKRSRTPKQPRGATWWKPQ